MTSHSIPKSLAMRLRTEGWRIQPAGTAAWIDLKGEQGHLVRRLITLSSHQGVRSWTWRATKTAISPSGGYCVRGFETAVAAYAHATISGWVDAGSEETGGSRGAAG